MLNANIAAAVQNEIGTRNSVTQLMPLVGALVGNGINGDQGRAVIADFITLQGGTAEIVARLAPDVDAAFERLAHT